MKYFGIGLFFLAGIIMYIIEIVNFNSWWGLDGIVIGVIVAPLAVLFPFIYWIKVGIFPFFYFIIWAAGLLGLFIPALLDNEKK